MPHLGARAEIAETVREGKDEKKGAADEVEENYIKSELYTLCTCIMLCVYSTLV